MASIIYCMSHTIYNAIAIYDAIKSKFLDISFDRTINSIDGLLEMKFLNANLYPFLDEISNCSWPGLNMSVKICFRKFHLQKNPSAVRDNSLNIDDYH